MSINAPLHVDFSTTKGFEAFEAGDYTLIAVEVEIKDAGQPNKVTGQIEKYLNWQCAVTGKIHGARLKAGKLTEYDHIDDKDPAVTRRLFHMTSLASHALFGLENLIGAVEGERPSKDGVDVVPTSLLNRAFGARIIQEGYDPDIDDPKEARLKVPFDESEHPNARINNKIKAVFAL